VEGERPQSVQAFLQALGGQTTPPADASPVLRSPSSAAGTLDPAATAQLEAALAQHLGPMAAILLKRQAKIHRSLEALRAALAQEIESDSSRRVFLTRTEALVRAEPASRPASLPVASQPASAAPSAPPTTAPPRFEPQFLSAVETELARHLGPLAAVLVRKSAAKARDRAELFLLLSDHIADPDQRRAFIRKSVAAFRDRS